MAFRPAAEPQRLRNNLRAAYNTAYYLASQNNLNVEEIISQMNSLGSTLRAADSALTNLQTIKTNGEIAADFAGEMDVPPADLIASYTAAQAAATTLMSDYNTNVLGLLPFPKSWDAPTWSHVDVQYNIDTPTNYKTNLIALRDALAVFA